MIKMTDIQGCVRYVAASDILEIREASASQRWHQVQSNVRTTEGWSEVRESAADLRERVEGAR